MADDPFEDLLELEDKFYKEGYDAGVEDSVYAGMIEGKVFGIEKGYEKAIELAKLHGRAMVWNSRISTIGAPASTATDQTNALQQDDSPFKIRPLGSMQSQVGSLPSNIRLQKHVENLLLISDGTTTRTDNSDESVTEFDDRIAKARTKAKIIANIVGESLNPTSTANSGIEDATGLSARH